MRTKPTMNKRMLRSALATVIFSAVAGLGLAGVTLGGAEGGAAGLRAAPLEDSGWRAAPMDSGWRSAPVEADAGTVAVETAV
ncbi:hypothetical protein AB0C90_13370 [Streptomyces sp. NPDC048550]|uniref:hypothetical protein n=2 Tax=unclassified Streptomyces TaxID=2593676 RepID=UPI00225637DA|nr:hypothetical protein [Streptomyces sp. NBC_00320]MCX5146467.1 hypothetical protein [Streptomyces sp. NBC_00320]